MRVSIETGLEQLEPIETGFRENETGLMWFRPGAESGPGALFFTAAVVRLLPRYRGPGALKLSQNSAPSK